VPSVPQFLLSRRQAAQSLSISLRTLDYLIAGGKLTMRRIGRRVLIEPAELERFSRRSHSTKTK
jgi:excisionase family DNA binding protein